MDSPATAASMKLLRKWPKDFRGTLLSALIRKASNFQVMFRSAARSRKRPPVRAFAVADLLIDR
jgi:hypothetical protein